MEATLEGSRCIHRAWSRSHGGEYRDGLNSGRQKQRQPVEIDATDGDYGNRGFPYYGLQGCQPYGGSEGALVLCADVLAARAEDRTVADVVDSESLSFPRLSWSVGAEADEDGVTENGSRLPWVVVVLAEMNTDAGYGGGQVDMVVDEDLRRRGIRQFLQGT